MGRPFSASGFRIPCLLALLLTTLWWAREQTSTERVAPGKAPGRSVGAEGRSTDCGRVVISADGQIVARAGYDPVVRVWRREVPWRVLPGNEVHLAGNEWVLTRSAERSVTAPGIGVWSLERPGPGRRLATDLAVRHLAVSADGEGVFVATAEGRIAGLDIRSGETFWELPDDSSRQWMKGLMALSDGRLAVFGRSEVQVWNVATGEPHCSSPIDHERYVWEGNGSTSVLLFHSLDRIFAAWDLETCRQSLEIEGFTARSPAALSADGRFLVLAGEKGRIGIWDLIEGQALDPPEIAVEEIASLRFFPNRHALFVTGVNGELRIHSLDDGEVRRLDSGRNRSRSQLHLAGFSAGGRWAVASNSAGNLEVLDLEHGELAYELKGPERKIEELAWSDDGKMLFAGTRLGGLTLFDVSRGEVVDYRSSGNTSSRMGGFVLGNGGEWLAAPHREGYVELFRTGEEEPYAELRVSDPSESGRSGPVRALAVDPTGQRMATASSGGPVSLWNVPGLERLFTLENPVRAMRNLGFSADGRYLLGYGMDARLAVWRLDHRRLVEVLEPVLSWPNLLTPGHEGWLLNLQERPFWRRWSHRAEPAFLLPLLPFTRVGAGPSEEIVGIDPHRRLTIYDRDLQPVWVSEDERGRGLAFAVSADGARMALGTHEPAVEVYARRSRQLVERITGHLSGVQALAWSPDGRFLASGDQDGVIHLRDGNSYELLARISLSCRGGWLVAAPDGRWDADGSHCAHQPLGAHTEADIEPLRFEQDRREAGFWRKLGMR